MVEISNRPMAPERESGPIISEAEEAFGAKRALIVVAHPDDEVLFAGSILPLFREILLLHVTDGAPSRRIARSKGFPRRLDYARARRRELENALDAGAIHATLRALPIRDRHAAFAVGRIVSEVAACIASFHPDVILTHAYAGEHIDHDTTAFAVHVAAKRMGTLDRVWGMACYSLRTGTSAEAVFPGIDGAQALLVHPSESVARRKERMLDCFVSQTATIAWCAAPIEGFRRVAKCDFARPPCPGPLGYEVTRSGLDSALWRGLMASHVSADERAPRHVHRTLLRTLLLPLVASRDWRLHHCGKAGRVEAVAVWLMRSRIH